MAKQNKKKKKKFDPAKFMAWIMLLIMVGSVAATIFGYLLAR